MSLSLEECVDAIRAHLKSGPVVVVTLDAEPDGSAVATAVWNTPLDDEGEFEEASGTFRVERLPAGLRVEAIIERN